MKQRIGHYGEKEMASPADRGNKRRPVVCGSIWTFFTVLPPVIDIRMSFLIVKRVKMTVIGGEFLIFRNFRELSFWGPC